MFLFCSSDFDGSLEESRDDLQSVGNDTPVPLVRSDSYTTLLDATWQSNPDFQSHGTTFKRDNVDVNVRVIPPPKPGKAPTSHVMLDLYGECRDTFDHRTDKTDRLFEDIRDALATG